MKVYLRANAPDLVKRSKAGVQVPSEILEAMGIIAGIIESHRKNKRSRHHKAAMLVDVVAYEYTDPKQMGWIAVHFLKGHRMKTAKINFRSVLASGFSWSNRTYQWSGLINNSNIPLCDSRLAIGPRSKLYGLSSTVYSKGYTPTQILTGKF